MLHNTGNPQDRAEHCEQDQSGRIYSGVFPAMSLSHWMHHVAIRRALAFFIAGSIAIGVGWYLWPSRPPVLTGHQDLETFEAFFAGIDPECAQILAARDQLPIAVPKQVDDCADKETNQKKGYRDLLQSLRSANAAEEAARFAYDQTRTAIVGATFLLLTLWATAWAAWAAADAARIAKDSVAIAVKANDLAQQALVADQRAWLTATLHIEGPFTSTSDGAFGVVRAKIANIGKTPALNAHTNMMMLLLPPDPPESLKITTEAVRNICAESKTAGAWGRLVLPGESYIRLWSPGVDERIAIDHANRLAKGR